MSSEDIDYDGPPPEGAVIVSPTAIRYNANEMYAAIVRAAAATLVEQTARDLRQEAASDAKTQVRDQVATIVADVLEKPFQPTNEFGEAKGEKTTLREMARVQALNYLGVMVDKDGRPGSYHANQTRLQYLVTKTVAEVFDYQLKSEIKKAVDLAVIEAKAQVGAVVGDLVVKIGGR